MEDKGIWVYDIETLSNCFTYTAMNRDTQEIVQYTIWREINEMDELMQHLESARGLIGFNNLSFDYPVLHHMMNVYPTWEGLSTDDITDDIYQKAQETIADEWSMVKPMYVKIPQLDLFKIWHFDNVARMTSLKKLEIALRYPNVQDMPYKHSDIIETREQVQEILDYNLNDVKATYDFYQKSLGKIELRKGLYDRYGLRGMNYSDSKIGEQLTLKLYCQATEQSESFVKTLRTPRDKFKFKECLPSYLHFETEEFQGLRKYLEGIEVKELKGSFKYSFIYDGFQFDLGTGGIHGCIAPGVYESDNHYIIVDVDVASLYPSLAIVNRLYPEHLGEEFVDVYNDGIVKPRLKAKKEGDKVMNMGFKLSANSVYGKSNSQYSWLYDPLYTLKTTLAGQLSLCMLSEQLMTTVDDLTMIQINTDGLTAKIPRSESRKFYEQCKAWEAQTGLVLEYAAYDMMVVRDVNSYLAKYKDGKVKYKGAFQTYDEIMKNEEYNKSMSQMIVPEAIAKYFLDGIPVEETIMKATNIYDFCKTFNASHGWVCETVDTEGNTELQQKNNRYFISTDGKTFRKTKDERIIEIEAGGTLVTIFNTFVDKPSILDYNIDYDYYINECYKIIHKIDGTEERLLEQKRQEKETEQRAKQEEKFLKYCINKVPTERQLRIYGKDWLLEKYGTPKTK